MTYVERGVEAIRYTDVFCGTAIVEMLPDGAEFGLTRDRLMIGRIGVRRGEWVVRHADDFVEVLDDSEFRNRYEWEEGSEEL